MLPKLYRVLPILVLLGGVLSCSGHGQSTLPQPTTVINSPTLVPGGRLPGVLARIDLSTPGGDAYTYQLESSYTFDESGQMIIRCRVDDGSPALMLMELAGFKRRFIPLPEADYGWWMQAAKGRVYMVRFVPKPERHYLTALDLATGRVLAEEVLEKPDEADHTLSFPLTFQGGTLGPDGRLYLLLGDRLEVRDSATLKPVPSLPLQAADSFYLDKVRGRLYLISKESLQAYRAKDLDLLWQASLSGEAGADRPVADRAGHFVYVRAGFRDPARLLCFDAESGQALEPLTLPSDKYYLTDADSAADYLSFFDCRVMDERFFCITHLDGRPSDIAPLPVSTIPSRRPDGRLLELVPDRHLLRVYDAASLRPQDQITLGVEIEGLVADPGQGRLYLNDSTGRIHVIDSRTFRIEASLDAGSGPMALDAANHLLFVARELHGRQVAVIDTTALTVTATITGGWKVAVDSAGHRAFVGGYREEYAEQPLDRVEVWDTRTWQHLSYIPHAGEPTYNPLRDEVYLRNKWVYVVDGKTLIDYSPFLPPAHQGKSPLPPFVDGIAVDPELDVIAITLHADRPSDTPSPTLHLFSASTREPVTHTVTVIPRLGGEPLIFPPEQGRVYLADCPRVQALRAGTTEVLSERGGLCLDLYVPGTQLGLSQYKSGALVYDLNTWAPLGQLSCPPIRMVDRATHRLYAWEGSVLTVLSCDGGQAAPPEPAEPWPAGQPFESIREIHFSPDYARDQTIFVVTWADWNSVEEGKSDILRSTDGGKTWMHLRGGLPGLRRYPLSGCHLALSPAYSQDRTLFMGQEGRGTWRSSDGGETWTPIWQGLEDLSVTRVAVSPRYAKDRTVLAWTANAIFRSQDGGGNWSSLVTWKGESKPDQPPPAEVLPYLPAVQFRCRYTQLLHSTDGGQTWQRMFTTPRYDLVSVACSPHFEQDHQIFALSTRNLYRSADGGRTWRAADAATLNRSQPWQDFSALAVCEDQGGKLCLAVGDSAGSLQLFDPNAIAWDEIFY